MDNDSIAFKSNIKKYWLIWFLIIIIVLIINLFVIKDSNKFSFEIYFLFMIPAWMFTLMLNNYEANRIKITLQEYIEKNYPEKYKEYSEKPIDYLKSDSQEMTDYYEDKELLKDNIVLTLKNESKQMTIFVYVVAISMPILLVTSYFFILR